MGTNEDGSSGNENPAVQLRQVAQQVMSVSQTSPILRLQFDYGGQNMIKYASIESTQKDRLVVDSNGNLILTD